jgi:hypothetical protein
MTLTEAVLSVLLRLPGPWEAPATAEPPAERVARLETIATSIGVVAEESALGWRWGRRELAAALIAVTYPESHRYSRDVHDGRRRGDHEKAACLGQVHQQRMISREEWKASMGTDIEATTLCMRLVARVLGSTSRCVRRGRELDAVQVARLFASYGTGRTCNPTLPFARSRGRHWAAITVDLHTLFEGSPTAYA